MKPTPTSSAAAPTLKTGRANPHPDPLSGAAYSAVELMPGDRHVALLDQRLLPAVERYLILSSVEEVASAIRTMQVRGAPAIGVAAAYGLVLAARAADGDARSFERAMQGASDLLVATRPTAKNLAWALGRLLAEVPAAARLPRSERNQHMAGLARALHRSEVAACRRIGEIGARDLRDGMTVLTHCNAGALATAGYGTALGVVRAAHAAGKKIRVLADETRPLLQGARLTAWELMKDGIPVEVVTDGMVGALMAGKAVDWVVVGADRIARTGDVANKIGTYGVACLARLHDVPFTVAAPMSTVDFDCARGEDIPIEQRSEAEVTHLPAGGAEVAVAPEGARARNPAFDVTPARLVHAIYTELGPVSPVHEASLAALRQRGESANRRDATE
jgi:methylthioribose-1-phosphate isomerase